VRREGKGRGERREERREKRDEKERRRETERDRERDRERAHLTCPPVPCCIDVQGPRTSLSSILSVEFGQGQTPATHPPTPLLRRGFLRMCFCWFVVFLHRQGFGGVFTIMISVFLLTRQVVFVFFCGFHA